jgi:hypothetical protein
LLPRRDRQHPRDREQLDELATRQPAALLDQHPLRDGDHVAKAVQRERIERQ